MTRGVEGDFGCGWRGVGGLLGVSGEEARHSDVPLPLLCNEIEKQYHMAAGMSHNLGVILGFANPSVPRPSCTPASIQGFGCIVRDPMHDFVDISARIRMCSS